MFGLLYSLVKYYIKKDSHITAMFLLTMDTSEMCSDKSVYLITYSQVDLDKVPTREALAEMFVKAFGEDVVQK